MLTHDELWEKAGTNEPITREDLGINVSPIERIKEGMAIMKQACNSICDAGNCLPCPFLNYCDASDYSPHEWEIKNE